MRTSLDIANEHTKHSNEKRLVGDFRPSPILKDKQLKRKHETFSHKFTDMCDIPAPRTKAGMSGVKLTYHRPNKLVVLCGCSPKVMPDRHINGCESRAVGKLILPPIKITPAENQGVYLHGKNPCLLCDVTNSSKCFRNAVDKTYRFTSYDRAVLRSTGRMGIKGEDDSYSTRFTYTTERDTPETRYINTVSSLPPVIMSSLKLDNRHDMAANDHVRHHLKRQEQWIHTERLKNWRRTNGNKLTRKVTYQHSSSSGQKSDVNSGNSGDSLTQSSASSDPPHPVVEEMDEEQREAIDKCLRWMEHLPKKFSGMHIIMPVPEPTDQS